MRQQQLFIVQIGANDGVMADPINRFVTANRERVRGIVVEPVEDYFEELKQAYKDCAGITPVNVAIHNTEKEMTIYRVDPAADGLAEWTKGIASFNKDHHRLSGTPVDVMIAEQVPCISLDELIRLYDVTSIDLLQIDCEGYDSEIILGMDLVRIRPSIIHFEHGLMHKIMSEQVFSSVTRRLEENGYEIEIGSYDAIASLPEAR